MAGVVEEVTIKKEIEDPDSPDQADGQDSTHGQAENTNSQKLTKVWGEEETRSLIELAKIYIPKFKDSTYTKRQLLEDISKQLQMSGFHVTPEHVRNKLKYLRTRYRNVINYNAKHVEKRVMPFSDELSELYSLDYFEDQDFYGMSEHNGNGSSDFVYTPPMAKKGSKSKTIPASHVDLRTVVTSKKKVATQVIHKGTKFAVKKKSNAKSRGQPLFQCGLCMEKFKTSHDMHEHACQPTVKVSNDLGKKKINSSSSNSSNNVFTVWLKPTGNAPIIKNKKWIVERECTIAKIMGFLKKLMNLDTADSVFLYVNQSFAPSPDYEVGNVYECFNINGKLVLHYSTSPAWG